MNIILDTNIFVQNYLMDSRSFELLFDYLKKTNSKIFIPKIVYAELIEKYQVTLLGQLDVLEKAQDKLDNILLEFNRFPNEIDVELEVSNYSEYVLEKIGINEGSIVQHKANYLDELITRAIKRKKPFSEKGEEFRDALLWLAVVDITAEMGGTIVFISNDSRAYGKAGILYDDLLEEIEQKGIQVHYFTSIKAFIEKQAIQVEFVNESWLSEVIDFEKFDQEIEEQLSKRLADPMLYSSWDEWKDLEFTGYITRTADVDVNDIYGFFVYEKVDNNLYIEVVYNVEYEAEFSFEERSRKSSLYSDYPYDDLIFTEDDEHKYTYKHPEAEIIFGIEASDGQVSNIELVSTYL